MKLCLNMIVKNEAARIERCLASVVPFISSYAILDTGSTDNTIELIETHMDSLGIPGVIRRGEFKNFSQARNEALDLGRALPAQGDVEYFLLVDADMELIVETISAFNEQLETGLEAYSIVQKAGGMSYNNVRLLRTNVKAKYIGVTHEYLSVREHALLNGVLFVDHADGANRKNKADRDIALLSEEVAHNPDNDRAWFYLANTYRDAGLPTQAIAAYNKRVSLGGWDEEVWNSKMNIALCKLDLEDEQGFVTGMNEAFNFRPVRAEPLYELAKFYRQRGMNHTALMYAERGKKIPKPSDSLFVSDFVYDEGLLTELSISGFYDETTRPAAFEACNYLAVSSKVTEHGRRQARSNLQHYLRPLDEFCGSFAPLSLEDVVVPSGYSPMNPSVAAGPYGDLYCIVRTVNYTITVDGKYQIKDADGATNEVNPIITRNIMTKLGPDLAPVWAKPIIWRAPPPAFHLVLGLEDMRLFFWNSQWWATACVRELNYNGVCQQVLVRIEDTGDMFEVVEWKVLSGLDTYEKNWMPMVLNDTNINLVSRLDTIFGYNMSAGYEPAMQGRAPALDVGQISGGSQMVEFRTGFLGVVHEARYGSDGQRFYQHRFAWLNHRCELRRLSLPFFFEDKQIEFAAGLAPHPDGNNFVVSYGVRDKEAKIAKISRLEIASMLGAFHDYV